MRENLRLNKLQKLAEAGDGKFFLANNKDMLQKIYKEIDKSETTKIKVASYQVYTYFYYSSSNNSYSLIYCANLS